MHFQHLVGYFALHQNRFPIGKTEQVKAWEHAIVQHFWAKWYFPGNVTLYIVGDLDRPNEEVIGLIEASFGRFPAGAGVILVWDCAHAIMHVMHGARHGTAG